MHVALTDDLSEKLKMFSSSRKKSMTRVINYALELLFSLERVDAVKDTALKATIERKFVVPKNIPISSFYIFLYLLSKNFPNDSSRDFWNETVYISSLDKTNKEVFLEIQDEYKNSLKAGVLEGE